MTGYVKTGINQGGIWNSYSGALESFTNGGGHPASNFSSGYTYHDSFDFDASRCSEVYSDDMTTVIVDSLKVGFYIRY